MTTADETQLLPLCNETQVLPLTQSFLIPIGSVLMTPHQEGYCSLSLLPAIPLSQAQTIKGLYELTLRPPRALNLALCILPELQIYKDTVSSVALGAEVQ